MKDTIIGMAEFMRDVMGVLGILVGQLCTLVAVLALYGVGAWLLYLAVVYTIRSALYFN